MLARSRKEITDRYAVTTCREYPEFFDASVSIENDVWDDISFLDYTSAHHAYYDALLEQFPDYHLCMIELETGDLVATGMCVPLYVPPGQALPRNGWDWIVETAHEQGGRKANTLAALSISVPEQHRHRGLARDMITSMRGLAAMTRVESIIAPVRPSAKSRYPMVPMDDYISWSDPRGRIFDPWLRSHVAVGGRIEGVCDRSMVVEKPLEFWRSWTDADLDGPGPVTIEGALVPLQVDHQCGIGRYVEPNVWVRHFV